MPFGEVVIGSPGSGKSTYAYGKYQLLSALERKCVVINLDPANDHVQYPCAIDINELITVPQVMREYELGPNGAMLFCMEYLEANFDWLEERLKAEGIGEDDWVIFDCPGQVELSTNHNSLKNITERLGKFGFRLAVVHLCDAHYVTDASKYVSVLLLSLRAMLHLGLPHINVLSKLDLIKQYGELSFNLDFYTEVQDLSYLQHALSESSPKFAQLNMRICELIEDYNYVAFETLAVEDKQSMIHLMRTIDRALGYAFVATVDDASVAISPAGAPRTKVDNRRALFSSAASVIPDVPRVAGKFSAVSSTGQPLRPYTMLRTFWAIKKDPCCQWLELLPLLSGNKPVLHTCNLIESDLHNISYCTIVLCPSARHEGASFEQI